MMFSGEDEVLNLNNEDINSLHPSAQLRVKQSRRILRTYNFGQLDRGAGGHFNFEGSLNLLKFILFKFYDWAMQ